MNSYVRYTTTVPLRKLIKSFNIIVSNIFFLLGKRFIIVLKSVWYESGFSFYGLIDDFVSIRILTHNIIM